MITHVGLRRSCLVAAMATFAAATASARPAPGDDHASSEPAWLTGSDAGFTLDLDAEPPRDGVDMAADAGFDPLSIARLNFGMFQDQDAAPADGASANAGKSAADVAAELANPNSDLAQLKFQNQFYFYKGDLPNANDQWNYTLLFQPIFPFSMGETDSGDKLTFFLRPAIPLLVEQPVFNINDLDFGDASGFGDIQFDTAIGLSNKEGWQLAFGINGTLPTATDSALGGGQLRLGPEMLLAKQGKLKNDMGYFLGVFPSHQWDVTGWRDGAFSTTKIQPLVVLLPGDGWGIATEPIMAYDWIDDQWTIPLNLRVNRTVKLGEMPLKVELEFNYYVEQADAFGPEWMISLNLTPVVNNFFETMFK